jgi:bifunctional non-homologous end joining protein LigD
MPTVKKRRAESRNAVINQVSVTPMFVAPMTARPVERLPEGDDWIYEIEFDGYRALLRKDENKVQIRSRNNEDMSDNYPSIIAAGARLRANSAILDGQIVALDRNGRPCLQALHHRDWHPNHRVVFHAFDLLYLNGEQLTEKPLKIRRSKLPAIISGSGLLLSGELPGTPAHLAQAARSLGLEGIIAKRQTSNYQPGSRSSDWLKLKFERQQNFVIGGFRPAGNRIDALLVGYHEGGKLRFAGEVRAGFIPTVRRELFQQLSVLRIMSCPFADLSTVEPAHWGGGIADEEMQWINPELLAQIRFVEWTAEGRLRHATFLGLRLDKSPRDVHRDS